MAVLALAGDDETSPVDLADELADAICNVELVSSQASVFLDVARVLKNRIDGKVEAMSA